MCKMMERGRERERAETREQSCSSCEAHRGSVQEEGGVVLSELHPQLTELQVRGDVGHTHQGQLLGGGGGGRVITHTLRSCYFMCEEINTSSIVASFCKIVSYTHSDIHVRTNVLCKCVFLYVCV